MEVYARSKGVNATECMNMKNQFYDKKTAIILNFEICIDDKIISDTKPMRDLEVKYIDVMDELTKFSKEATDCTKDTDTFLALVGAFKCILDVSCFFSLFFYFIVNLRTVRYFVGLHIHLKKL